MGPTPAQIAAFNANLANTNSGIPNNGFPAGFSAGNLSPQNPDGSNSAPQGSAVGSNANSATSGLGGGTATMALFQPLYDAQIGGYQQQLGGLGGQQDAEKGSIQNQYNPQYTTLQDQRAQGNANIDIAQGQLDNQRSTGLRNIGSNLRTALNGYQQQLGVQGAGDSSAAGLLGYGLTQQGNNQVQDLTNQSDLQQTGLNTQRSSLEQNFNDQLGNLDAWKSSQLTNIGLKYQQMQSQLQNQIESTKGEEARYLAMYGQTALAQQAIASLQGLESQYADQHGQLVQHFQSLAAPTPQADISKFTGQPAVTPFNVQSLQGLSFANNQDQTQAPTSTASLTRKPDGSPAGV